MICRNFPVRLETLLMLVQNSRFPALHKVCLQCPYAYVIAIYSDNARGTAR